MTIKAPRASSIPDLYYGKYVSSLFSEGEQGVWYDPSDLSTMFQDAAGTTPVTGVEQPVGLMLDKSKGVLGWNGAKRVNLLRRTRQLQDTVWTKANDVTVTDNYGLAPDGTNTATRVRLARSSNGYAEIFQRVNLTSNLKVRVWLKALAGTPTIATTYDNAPNGAYKNIVTLSQEWTEYEFDIATNTTGGINLITWSALPQTSLTADFLVWNPDLRLASDANTLPKYQRVDADWSSTIPGNHATQTTTASRPVLSARVNLLTNTENFSSWANLNSVVIANAAASPNGLPTASLLYPSSSGNARWVYQLQLGSAAGGALTRSVYAKANGKRFFYITWDGNGALSKTVFFDLINGTLGSVANGATASIFSVGNGWYKCTLTIGSTVSTDWGLICGPSDANNSINVTADGTSGIYLWGADLRVANESSSIPSYQRVNTATDYDTQGFPLYLRFDGVDDSLVTPSINFTATDKMAVFAGVRKLSDSATGAIAELGGNPSLSNGTFWINSGAGLAPNDIWAATRGSQYRTGYGFTAAAPVSGVLSVGYSLSGTSRDECVKVRWNGGTPVLVGALDLTARAGSYGNYPIYIGRRAVTSNPFNGRLYGLVVRGAQTDDLHLTNVERYLASKSGIVL